MVKEKKITNREEITKLLKLFCEKQLDGILSFTEDNEYKIRFFEYDNNIKISFPYNTEKEINFICESKSTFWIEVTISNYTIHFPSKFIDLGVIEEPEFIISHISRRHKRIKIYGTQLDNIISAFVGITIDYPDFSIKSFKNRVIPIIKNAEDELIKKGYSFAKVYFYGNGLKNIISQLITKFRKPFVVFNTSDLYISHSMSINYDDYIHNLKEKHINQQKIDRKLQKIENYYKRRNIKSEAYIPLIYQNEVLGHLHIYSKNRNLDFPELLYLQRVSQNLMNEILRCLPLKIISEEKQILLDLSISGAKMIITDPYVNKILNNKKGFYIQVFYRDMEVLNTFSHVVNFYEVDVLGHNIVGVKFEEVTDHNKRNDFIEIMTNIEYIKEHIV